MSYYAYTGIGSRKAPPEMCAWATKFGAFMSEYRWILRSGAAQGMDEGFERGATYDRTEIFLPWPGFQNRRSSLPPTARAAYEIAATVHPAWSKLGGGARSLHARNVHQVLGPNLDVPSQFVVCWTPDGCETEAERTKDTGGTATAIVLAARHGIPVYNMAKPGSFERLQEYLMGMARITLRDRVVL
jgi:hypothetical protein